MESPYAALWEALRQDQADRLPQGWRMGRVTRRKPLEITAGGIPLTKDSLTINSIFRGAEFQLGEQVLLLDTSGQGQSFLILCRVEGL